MLRKVTKIIKEIEYTQKNILIFFVIYLLISSFILVTDFSYLVKTPIAIFNFIIVLGGLISYNMGIKKGNDKIDYYLVSVGFGITGLILWGLFINTVLPFGGIIKPFSSIPLVSSLFTLTALLLVKPFKEVNSTVYKVNFEIDKTIFLYLTPFLILIVALLGTGSLNIMGSNFILLFLYPLIVFYFIYLFNRKNNTKDSVYFLTIYMSSLALLFTYSLRGHNILGWDINEEFQVFSKTLENLRWSMSFYKSLDYNACLSITILPTILRVLTGISDQYIFKFVFQLFFALVPVSVFVISKKYISEKYALCASFLFMSQVWFYEQMPGLVRQEIAFLLYSLLLVILLNTEWSGRARKISSVFLLLGLVLSHYTTSYIFIILAFVLYLVSLVSKIVSKNNEKTYYGSLFLITLLSVFVWQVFFTNTGDAFVKLVNLNRRTGIEQVSNEKLSEPDYTLVNYVKERIANESNVLKSVYVDIVTPYLIRQDKTKFDNIEASKYLPKLLKETHPLQSKLPDYLVKIILVLGKVIKVLFQVLLPILGIIYFIKNNYKNHFKSSFSLVIINLTGSILLSLMVLIPFLQIHYNLTRLFLQVYISLAVFAVMGVFVIVNYFSVNRSIIIALISFFFLMQTGFMGQFIGSDKKITLNTIPSDQYTYFINDTEVYSAKWLRTQVKSSDKIQADNMANLRLQSFGNMNAYSKVIFPLSVRRTAFLYTIKMNVVDRMAFMQFQNISYKFEFPLDYISEHKNTIYNNGDSMIFK